MRAGSCLLLALVVLAFVQAGRGSSLRLERVFERGQQLEAAGDDPPHNPCFPDCKWKCAEPSCPAECEPQCEKPSCELRCEKLPATVCDIRCEKPKCEVRCSKKNCQAGGCPLCENVCLPAKCQTVCTPAVPTCKPTCSPPKCTWSCRKPGNCPKPKCALACAHRPAQPACGSQAPKCCSCHKFENMQAAVELASSAHRANKGISLSEDMTPSFVDIAHEFRFNSANPSLIETEGCCPCA